MTETQHKPFQTKFHFRYINFISRYESFNDLLDILYWCEEESISGDGIIIGSGDKELITL